MTHLNSIQHFQTTPNAQPLSDYVQIRPYDVMVGRKTGTLDESKIISVCGRFFVPREEFEAYEQRLAVFDAMQD